LVRFVRELLGLNLLENLTAGLHEAGNITRIEKSVPALQRAREIESDTSAKVQVFETELRARSSEWQQAVSLLQTEIAIVGDPAPTQPWTPEGIEQRVEAQARSAQSSLLSGMLHKLRHSEGLLERALGLLASESAQVSPIVLRERLDSIIARIDTLEKKANEFLIPAEGVLTRLGHKPVVTDDLSARITGTQTILRNVITRRQSEAEALARLVADITALRNRQSELSDELASLEDASESPSAIVQRWAEVLTTVLEHTEGDTCPICRRDYTELGRGSLRVHITDEISRIGADVRRMEEQARRRAQLAAEHTTIVQRAAAYETQASAERERQISEGQETPNLETLATGLNTLTSISRDWQDSQTSARALRNALDRMETLERQRNEATAEIEQIALALSLPENLRSSDPRAFATAAITCIREQVDSIEKETAGANRLREVLDRTHSVGKAWQDSVRQAQQNTESLQKARELRALMMIPIESARKLSRAATEAKTRLLEQIFNEKLNTLWADLYRRLAKEERFHPRLAEPTTVRGLIRTSIEGRYEGADPFQQFASVASSGNLNTAALSLFLSLHLIEKPLHHFIVIDDPVQSMDDLHVVQLANLLREIRRQSKRQLILAVHERALFDYLRLELGPTEPEASLATIELHTEPLNKRPRIDCSRIVWKPDTVRFGRQTAAKL
jgi:exonuclease SbcC